MALIETTGISQVRDGRETLRKIDLTIERGEVFSLIGPTGSGKTTLLRIVNLLDPPASGKILIDGEEVNSSERKKLEVRRRMAFVLQKPVVFNMSVFENIASPLRWRNEDKAYIVRKVDEMLEITGLTGYRNRNARRLSGGETQMVALARALVSDPEILLLDEPSANLDPTLASRMEHILKGVIGRGSTTIMMSTHDMAEGQRLANRVGVMLNGEILQTGGWREVFNSPHSPQVARFVGVENMIDGIITANQDTMVMVEAAGNTIEAISGLPAGSSVCVCLRPEDITLALSRVSSSARNVFPGTVRRLVTFGALARVEIDCGFPLVSLITSRSAEEMGLAEGMQLYCGFKATAAHIIERQGEG